MHPPLRHVRAGLLAAAAVLAFSLAACGESAGEAAAEAALVAAGAGDVEIDDDGGTVSYRTEQGQVTITGGDAAALPRDFPDDVYLPGDYVVESTLAMEQDLFIALAVQEDVPALYAAARAAMAGHGWTETMAALENNENGLMSYEKADRAAVLSLARGEGATTMGLQLTRVSR